MNNNLPLQEIVAECLQRMSVQADELDQFGITKPEGMTDDQEIILRGGTTLLFDEYGPWRSLSGPMVGFEDEVLCDVPMDFKGSDQVSRPPGQHRPRANFVGSRPQTFDPVLSFSVGSYLKLRVVPVKLRFQCYDGASYRGLLSVECPAFQRQSAEIVAKVYYLVLALA